MEALPPDEVEVRRHLRPPAVFHDVTGVVFGKRFVVRGIRDADGRWREVMRVRVL